MANMQAGSPQSSPRAIAAWFESDSKAEKAIDQLKASGFTDAEIGVATPHRETQVGFWERLTSRFGKHEHTERANDFVESLGDSGVPEQQASYFNSRLDDGGVLITVHSAADKVSLASSILQQNGADMGSATTERKRVPQTGEQGGQTIRLVGEILRVHKERIARGEVRLRKEIVTETQNIQVPTTREELVVERTPLQGQEASNLQVGSGEKEIRIPLAEERVEVEKVPVVNEEVRVGKREVQDTQRVSDQIRHEELKIDGANENLNQDTAKEMEKEKDKNKRAA